MTNVQNETPLKTSTDTKPSPIAGLHHVTGITQDVWQNARFYTEALGLRLVKITINYDDPGSYHLYYGDALGRPGTALTFFGYADAQRGSAEAGGVSETAFAIAPGAAAYWTKRLSEKRIAHYVETRFREKVITLRDPDGMGIALVESAGAEFARYSWKHANVPAEHALRGFHSVTLMEKDAAGTAKTLVDQFGFRETEREGGRIRYESHLASPAHVVDVVVNPTAGLTRMGAGQIHHVAFRTPDETQQRAWQELLARAGRNVSPVMERDYFRSIYFREPGGVLFEIATDGPGFTINETPENLGTRIMLPGWLEERRSQIESLLPQPPVARVYPNIGQEEGV